MVGKRAKYISGQSHFLDGLHSYQVKGPPYISELSFSNNFLSFSKNITGHLNPSVGFILRSQRDLFLKDLGFGISQW